jgi:hypothetical protein
VLANAVALFKNHLLDLNVEILRKDFTFDDTERVALANSAYDAAHELCSCVIFLASPSPVTTTVPRLCNFYLCCNEQ